MSNTTNAASDRTQNTIRLTGPRGSVVELTTTRGSEIAELRTAGGWIDVMSLDAARDTIRDYLGRGYRMAIADV